MNIIKETISFYDTGESDSRGKKFRFKFRVVSPSGKALERQKTLFFVNTQSAIEWVDLLKRHGKWVSPTDKLYYVTNDNN